MIDGQNTNHRGYPTVELQKRSPDPYGGPLRIEFWVYLHVPIELCDNQQWF